MKSLLPLLLLAVGCVDGAAQPLERPVVHVRIDASTMTAEQQEQAVAAVDEWDCPACPRLELDFGPANGWYSIRVVPQVELDLIEPNLAGWAGPDGVRVVAGPHYSQAVAHEVGHMLGLGHSATCDSVMYANGDDGSFGVTAKDIEDLTALWADRI